MSVEPRKRGRPSKADILARAAEDAREAGPNRAEEGSEAAEPMTELAAMLEPEIDSADLTLHQFISGLECTRQGFVLTLVEHPDAAVGIYEGRLSGVRTAPGALRAVWNDGFITKPDAGRLPADASQDQPGNPESEAAPNLDPMNV